MKNRNFKVWDEKENTWMNNVDLIMFSNGNVYKREHAGCLFEMPKESVVFAQV